MNDSDIRLIVIISIVALAAGAAWYFRDEIWRPDDLPAAAAPEVPASRDAPDIGPIHPIEPVAPAGPSDRELVPLPALDDSDSYFVLEMINLFGPEAGRLLVSEALIDKIVATVDNLPRSQVAERTRPVGRLATTFIIEESASGNEVYLSPANYERYSELVDLLDVMNIDAAAEMYRRFYPLFQESYVRLGYPNGYFNDRVVEVIDHLLATPRPDYPLRLVRPNVLYEYADPDLQALSSGQKLMLRIGPDHADRVRETLLAFRARIARE